MRTRYPAMHPAQGNWAHMRKTWTATEDAFAHEYEMDFIDYQLHTENCFYVVAEHLVRYCGILHKAGEDILELIKAMTEMCPKPAPPGEGTFNLMSVLVTGLVAVTTTVISGGAGTTVGVVLGVAVVEMLGEGIKTAERNGEKNESKLESHYYLKDTANQYVEAVDKIESDTAQALRDLRDNLRRELDRLRNDRRYKAQPDAGDMTGGVPYFRDFMPR